MPILQRNTPIETSTPSLRIENDLAPGRYRVQLVVIDDEGHASAPAIHTITVVERNTPDTDPAAAAPGDPWWRRLLRWLLRLINRA